MRLISKTRFLISLLMLLIPGLPLPPGKASAQPVRAGDVGGDPRGRLDQAFMDDLVRKNWDTADGLPGMTITTLMQDKRGYVWIGTYDGLVRFDGVDFTTYSRSTDERYDFASARSIIEDSRGDIWVGHNDEGLTRIAASGEISKLTMDDGLPNNKVNALCEDKEGNIWVGTASGICILGPDGSLGEPEGLAALGMSSILVQNLFCDSRGRVWVSTGSAKDCFVSEGGRLDRFAGIRSIPDFAISVVTEDAEGAMWFGGSPGYAVRVKDGEETVYEMSPDGKSALNVNSLAHDSAGNVWIGSDAGIMVLHGGSHSHYTARNGLPDNGVVFIMEDYEGNIWIALNRGGLQKLSKGKFRPVRLPVSANSICEDRGRGVTWLACDDGLRCYKDGQFVENAVTDYCKGFRVRHAGLTRDGELLISSYSSVPLVRVLPDGSIRGWTTEDGIAANKGRVAIKTKDGDYYEGTPQGLSIIHHEDGHISTLTRDDGFTNHYIMWLYEDAAGRVWAGTNGGGVFVLEDERITRHYTNEEGLAGNVIFKILSYDGGIWIATGTGLSRYMEETDSFVSFSSRNGLGTDSVFQMICDDQGLVWMTCNKGVFSVPYSEMQEVIGGTRKKVSARYYGASDGLVTSGVTSTSLSEKDSAGRIWFTLTDGFAIYDPSKGGTNKFAPRIEIEDYTVDNVTSEWRGETIVLPPSAKRLSIKYTGMSFVSSDSMTFRYKLAGFDMDYSDWTPARSVSYTNLRPGTYQFMVVSQNSDGVQGEPSRPLTIIKEPYLWQRPWFWLLIVLAALALVAWKIYSMRSYQKVLEGKVAERTRELKAANEKAEGLLLNILPPEVAAELTEHPGRTIARKFTNATVLFTDIVGFTKMSGAMSAEDVVTMLNRLMSMFDERARREGIEKIKTIGDAYMAAAGLSEGGGKEDAEKMIRFAQGLLEDVRHFNEAWGSDLEIRVGVNTGNLVAGVIGRSKFIYDLWGDTVNVASRMESTGVPMRIHVSEATWEQTKDAFTYGEGVEVSVKGKGEMRTYFL